ncbi:glycine-rich RNA-binding protein [Dorcoceras hygrometricum]|uniref:Glycine-rich RNA-binding protein n=1 Tax=Dorcoceras hygrometricum TaxID=472368 RepID=A0A2Z7BQE1_9LAMI|nr:glycine-rich RNA-binding protein [Dorcoceras hygrometricum]
MAMEDSEFRCFVGGLAWDTTDQGLEQAFNQFGDVIDSKIINDRETGRSRGFGFVTFKDDQSMRDAIEGMNGQDLDGRNITVNEAQSRGGGGGGGGGGFRGPRRNGGGYGRREGGYGRREGGYAGGRGGGGRGYSKNAGASDGSWRN